MCLFFNTPLCHSPLWRKTSENLFLMVEKRRVCELLHFLQKTFYFLRVYLFWRWLVDTLSSSPRQAKRGARKTAHSPASKSRWTSYAIFFAFFGLLMGTMETRCAIREKVCRRLKTTIDFSLEACMWIFFATFIVRDFFFWTEKKNEVFFIFNVLVMDSKKFSL